ncbi:DMT family transporter [Marinobacterium sediminicola]|uniref:Threonine/homoserine efflux transporter RhtA n=1 Tax=Marinobacterium sediminicola TaxID=518898 RepID=A0ABY1RVV0_9GAMM|nr:DMT family transporter [Marinobacterium sediminicola]ULG70547.1 DMT family transporter [Marinobacterium sediminicola]SMR69040.1 Threonine/homoserine efflux transporter RhtA [Marinobacterium sediminicola]
MSSSSYNLSAGAGYALATTIVMSMAAVLIKLTAVMISIEMIVFFQYLLCVLVMLPWLKQSGLQALHTRRPWLHLIRGLSGWGCFYAYYLALEKIPLVDAALLRNSAPLCVPLLLLMWHRVGLHWMSWLPLILGFIGVGLIMQPEGEGLSSWHLVGFISALALAGSIVTTRELTQTEPVNRILFYYFLISALAGLPLAACNWQPVHLSTLPYILLIAGSIWLTMWLYTRSYSNAPASVIAPLSYLGVVFTGLWGWMIWDQVPLASTWAGIALVVLGGVGSVWIGSRLKSQH